MTFHSRLSCLVVGSMLLSHAAVAQADRESQDKPPDHSCTVSVAGEPRVWPVGSEGDNFNSGWGLQAGGGFAISHPVEPKSGVQWFLTANYMYTRLGANSKAFAAAQQSEPGLASATSAHGTFSAVTFDPTARYRLTSHWGLYALGGFGWFRRSVGFNGVNSTNLLHSGASTFDRVASNSGAFDVGGGLNYSLPHSGGLMIYAEGRFYQGAAINNATRLVPLSVGVRW
jgi:hypothetical protein